MLMCAGRDTVVALRRWQGSQAACDSALAFVTALLSKNNVFLRRDYRRGGRRCDLRADTAGARRIACSMLSSAAVCPPRALDGESRPCTAGRALIDAVQRVSWTKIGVASA